MDTKPETNLLLTAIEKGFEEAFRLFYGVYRAKVVDNKHEDDRGFVKIHVHGIGQSEPSDQWIEPMMLGGKDRGAFWPPDIGDWVWVMYDKGNPSVPLAYLPMGYGSEEVPAEFTSGDDHSPHRRGFVSRAGHSFVVSDEPGNEYVRLMWHKPDPGDTSLKDPSVSSDRTKGKFSFIELGKDGGLQIAAHNANFVINYVPEKDGEKAQFLIMDGKNMNILSMTEDGFTVIDKDGNTFGLNKGKFTVSAEKGIALTGKSADIGCGGVNLGFPAPMSGVCGEPLIAWLASHTHPTGVGPSGPATAAPTGPPPPTILSKAVKLKP